MVDSSLPIGTQALVMRTILEWCMAGRLPIPRNNFVAVAGPLLSAGSEQDHVELVRFFERTYVHYSVSSLLMPFDRPSRFSAEYAGIFTKPLGHIFN